MRQCSLRGDSMGQQAELDGFVLKEPMKLPHSAIDSPSRQSAIGPGGLANAFAAATSTNQALVQVHPSQRPQPGTAALRDLFLLPWNSVYFNASYGNVPWPVMQAQWKLQAQCEANPQEWMLGGVAPQLQRVRARVANYINCQAADVALVENCTSAANAVLRSIHVPAGGTLLHLSTAYGVIKNCMAHTAQLAGASVEEVQVEFRGGPKGHPPCARGGGPLADAVAAALDRAQARGAPVALACFDHIASCPGVLMPVMELARVCQARGVPVMLDGAHVLGQMRVDIAELEAAGVCFWISDAHKWLFSPKGSAVLWVKRQFQAEVYPAALGAVVRSSASLAAFQAAATAGLSEFEMRFQYTGTRDYTPLAAMDAAMDFREIIGEEAIVQYNHSMAVWAQTSLAALWGTETLVPEECTVAMAHVRLPAVRSRKGAAKLGAMLKQLHNIHVMLFTLPPPQAAEGEEVKSGDSFWVRPCFQVYVTHQDVELLGQAVLDLAPLAESAEVCLRWLTNHRKKQSTTSVASGVAVSEAIPVPPPGTSPVASAVFGMTPPTSNLIQAEMMSQARGLHHRNQHLDSMAKAEPLGRLHGSAAVVGSPDSVLQGRRVNRVGSCESVSSVLSSVQSDSSSHRSLADLAELNFHRS